MMVSDGAPAATEPPPDPEEVWDAALLQPLTASAVTAAAAAATVVNRLFTEDLSLLMRCGDGRTGGGSDTGITARPRRPPPQQSLLQGGDQSLGDQRDHRDHDHAGEHAVGIEVVLRVADEQPHPFVRAEQLADDGADEREAEADVQAGEDPGERRRQHHVPRRLPP